MLVSICLLIYIHNLNIVYPMSNKLTVDELLNMMPVTADRAELLPLLFKRGDKPYCLDDYPQFKELYLKEHPPQILYMCGRQIGKSTNLSISEILNCMQIRNFRILYVAPLQSQTHRYSSMYLQDSIRASKFASKMQSNSEEIEEDYKIVRSVGHQSFKNQSSILLTYSKTSSDRARGIPADCIDFDEIQDQLTDHLPIISESLANSDWGIKRYTGTAKTVDNTIEHLWQQSSMSEWTMKCKGCNHWNQPTLENKVFNMVSAAGVRCSKCGKLLNVKDGMWVAYNQRKNNEFRGYHIPQIVVPAIVDNKRKWNRLIKKVVALPPTITLQEIMGISADKGARLLTEGDVHKVCVLGPMSELQKKAGDYIFRVVGIDWGVAEQSSFTVATVLGITTGGQFHVLWAHRFLGGDPGSYLNEIARIYTMFNCDMISADFGMGFVNNSLLNTQFGLNVVSISYCKQNRLLSYNPLHGKSRWMIDKHTAMTLTFLAILHGKINFPSQADMMPYTPDLLSPYEEVRESDGSDRRVFVRNASVPDDFCHALVFATIAAMHYMGEPLTNLVPGNAYNYGVTGELDATVIDPQMYKET